MSVGDMQSPVIQRLLKYAQVPTHVIESQEARAIFNDLQHILCSNRITYKDHPYNAWNPIVEKDIIQVRNSMNLTRMLTVNREWEGR